jgi:hypothetical protein
VVSPSLRFLLETINNSIISLSRNNNNNDHHGHRRHIMAVHDDESWTVVVTFDNHGVDGELIDKLLVAVKTPQDHGGGVVFVNEYTENGQKTGFFG